MSKLIRLFTIALLFMSIAACRESTPVAQTEYFCCDTQGGCAAGSEPPGHKDRAETACSAAGGVWLEGNAQYYCVGDPTDKECSTTQ